ncbi:MAG: HD domain-containing protein [Cellvibrionaceae bacterium]|nr:HD domain-containing protein [Cellvibrionaceae bacterium]
MQTLHPAIAPISELFAEYGSKDYGEACSQTEHAISCAQHGERLGRDESLILAALLHDIGHFIADREQLPGFDKWGYPQHDQLGAERLARWGLPEPICEPIRLHVAAKRYLASHSQRPLSAASAATLALQGGPMSQAEAAAFERHSWFEHALQIRELDELGKPSDGLEGALCPWLKRLNQYLIQLV